MEYIHPINCAIDYIEANLTQEIDLSEVAAAAGYSLFHLSRLFRAMTGETPGGYIRKRRLSEAACQLLTSKRRILDIALDHQFGSQAAFTRAFRAAFGISPGAYRKRGRLARLTHRITLRQPRICYVSGQRGRDAGLVLPGQEIGQVLPARVLSLFAHRGPTGATRRALDRLYLLFY
jgi:AraC family transcriptional regulator